MQAPKICNTCETVAHCSRHGCIPITSSTGAAEQPGAAAPAVAAERVVVRMPNYDLDGVEWHLMQQALVKLGVPTGGIEELKNNVPRFFNSILHSVAALPTARRPRAAQVKPIDMVLHCPKCGLKHIDADEWVDDPHDIEQGRIPKWKNEPHRSHLCHRCGNIWRPADVPTNGVASVKTTGKADSPIAARAGAQAVPSDADAPDWVQLRSGLAMAMLGWATRNSDDQTFDQATRLLDAVTEPDMPLAILRSAPDWRTAAAHASVSAPACAQAAPELRSQWLNPEDMAALERLDETSSDGEGYDLPKSQMVRLADLGVVRHHSAGRYSITSFGRWVLGSQALRKPLETAEECNARLGEEHRARLAAAHPAQATPNEGGN